MEKQIEEVMENLVKAYNALRGDDHNYAEIVDGKLIRVYDDEGGVVTLTYIRGACVERNSPSKD